MNDFFYLIDNFKKNLIQLFSIPVIVIAFIYISYGDILDAFLKETNDIRKIYHLQAQITIFNSGIELPLIVKNIGYYSILFIYVLFVGWLFSYAFLSYRKLSLGLNLKLTIIIESVCIFFIYRLSVAPELNIWLALPGYLIISFVLVILILYSIFEVKSSYEKK